MSKKNQIEFEVTVNVRDYEKNVMATRTARFISPIDGDSLEDQMVALNVYEEQIRGLGSEVVRFTIFKASGLISDAMKAASEQEQAALPELPDQGEGNPAPEADPMCVAEGPTLLDSPPDSEGGSGTQ